MKKTISCLIVAVLLGAGGLFSTGVFADTGGSAGRLVENAAVSPSPTALEYRANVAQDDYRIGAHDLLEIEVFRVDDFSRSVRVNSTGDITLPLIGKIHAAGMSSQELEAALSEKLNEEYLQNPHVSVFIKEYSSQRVTVEGAVKKPGIFALTGRTTLLQSIAMAEGLTDLADADKIQLFRTASDGKSYVYEVDLKAIRDGEAGDPIVAGDDVIVVPKATIRSAIKSITDTLRGFVYLGRIPIFE